MPENWFLRLTGLPPTLCYVYRVIFSRKSKMFAKIAKEGVKDYMKKHGKFNIEHITVHILAEYLLDNYMEEMQDEVLRLGK